MTVDHDAVAGPDAGDAAPAPATSTPTTARFRYESGPKGGWVGVVSDSAVSPGTVVAQNAGSTLSGLYYRFGGAPVNGTFARDLEHAGQKDKANADVAAAYDAHYGSGAYATDAAGSPPRQDRLTSLLVPVTPGVPPIGPQFLGVLYSVGPRLGDKGIEDEKGYRAIYADGLAAIADWNRSTRTRIDNLRLILLSTGAFAGGSGGPALRAQAAGLVIDAVLDGLAAHPELANLTFLVNTKDAPGKHGDERVAFDTAAQARNVTTSAEGFDVPLQS